MLDNEYPKYILVERALCRSPTGHAFNSHLIFNNTGSRQRASCGREWMREVLKITERDCKDCCRMVWFKGR